MLAVSLIGILVRFGLKKLTAVSSEVFVSIPPKDYREGKHYPRHSNADININ